MAKKVTTDPLRFSPLRLAMKYVGYLAGAGNGKGHGIHSPFVFDFIRNVLNDRAQYPAYREIEKMRSALMSDNSPIPTEDYGAGNSGTSGAGGSRAVSSIARNSSVSLKYGRLLFRIARYYRSRYILELGSSLGVSTAYLASARDKSVVVSGEGNFVVASRARTNLDNLGLSNARIVTGNFDNTLSEMAGSVPHIDLAFIDGNHRKEPTERYFHELLTRAKGDSIFIFDDIHWSAGMESAWNSIREHSSVTLSIDLFFLGLVFFRPEFRVKQHFTIRY